MSKKLYEESNIQAIAEAIREKNGSQSTYTSAQMAGAVRSLHADPVLETLSVTENGLFVPRSGVDGFSSVNVSVPGGTPILQEKTVTENGIVLPDSGYDGLSKVTVDIPSGSQSNLLEYDWDLTKSYIDESNGVALIDGPYISNTDEGSFFTNSSSYLYLEKYIKYLFAYKCNSVKIEIDIGAMTFDSISSHHRFIMWTDDSGFIFRTTGAWSLYNGYAWATDSDIRTYNYFANSTVKIIIDNSGYWHIYKDNALVYEPDKLLKFQTGLSYNNIIGSANMSCSKITVKRVRLQGIS